MIISETWVKNRSYVEFSYFNKQICDLTRNKFSAPSVYFNDPKEAFRYMTQYLEGTLPDGSMLNEAIKWVAKNGEKKSVNNFDWSKATPIISDFRDKGQNYKKFDTEILAWTNYWNDRKAMSHSSGFKAVDPNVVKAILLVESSFGNDPKKNGTRDVMQSLYPGDPEFWLAAGLDPKGKGHVSNRFGKYNPKYAGVTFVDVIQIGNNKINNDAEMNQEPINTTERKNMGFGTGLKLVRDVVSTTGGGAKGNEYFVDYRKVTTRMSIAVGVAQLAYKTNLKGAKRAGALAYNGGGDSKYGSKLDAAMKMLGAKW